MGEAIAVLISIGVCVAIYQWRQRADRAASAARVEGHVRHLRKAEFRCACSWCLNTALARKLMVYERMDGTWKSHDVVAALTTMPSSRVEATVQAVFQRNMPNWRRFCSEKCVKEFLSAERVSAPDEFSGCTHCSFRFPQAVARCTSCGAARGA